jgi:hypothetical protein
VGALDLEGQRLAAVADDTAKSSRIVILEITAGMRPCGRRTIAGARAEKTGMTSGTPVRDAEGVVYDLAG